MHVATGHRTHLLFGWMFCLCFTGNAFAESADEPNPSGIYTWCSWSEKVHKKEYPFVKGVTLVPHWDQVEPTPGVYDWSTVDAKMKKATDEGLNIFLVMWFNPCCPEWLFENDRRRPERISTSHLVSRGLPFHGSR